MIFEQSGRQPRNGSSTPCTAVGIPRVAVAHDGIARVAARTDNEVRLKFIENGVRLTLRVIRLRTETRLWRSFLRPKGAVEGRDVDRAERIGVCAIRSRSSPRSAPTKRMRVWVSLPQEACERQRVDVSRRAAAGEKITFMPSVPFFLAAVCFRRGIFLSFSAWRHLPRNLSTTPISASWMASAVPPKLKNGSEMPVFGTRFCHDRDV